MPKVFIMRGLPGAGKSMWIARRCIENKCSTATVSADTSHYTKTHPDPVTGLMIAPVYDFKPENAKKAHDNCLREFLKYTIYERSIWQEIIVDNTNTSAWEIAPYYRLAEALGYEVEIIWLRCPVAKSIARNIHKVPEATIAKMADRLEIEILPSWWKQTVITENP